MTCLSVSVFFKSSDTAGEDLEKPVQPTLTAGNPVNQVKNVKASAADEMG